MLTKVVSFLEPLLSIGYINDQHRPFVNEFARAINFLYSKLKEGINPDENIIFFNGGDVSEDCSPKMIELLQTFEAIAPGNHELYATNTTLDKTRNLLNWVAANLSFGEEEYCPSYRIFEVKGIKMAVLGFAHFPSKEMASKSNQFKILGRDKSLDTAQSLVSLLKMKDVKFFFFLTHYPIDWGRTFAKNISSACGLNHNHFLVFCGHDHEVYPTNSEEDGDNVMESGSYLSHVGIVRVYRRGEGFLFKKENLLIPQGQESKLLLPFYYEDDSERGHIRQDYFRSNPMGARMTDMLKTELAVDAFIINSGGVRAGLIEDYRVIMTPEEMAKAVFPFKEPLVKLSVDQKGLMEILRFEAEILNSNERKGLPLFSSKLFFQVSGISYSIGKRKGKFVLENMDLTHFTDGRIVVGTNLFVLGMIKSLKEIIKAFNKGHIQLIKQNGRFNDYYASSLLPKDIYDLLVISLVEHGYLEKDTFMYTEKFHKSRPFDILLDIEANNWMPSGTEQMVHHLLKYPTFGSSYKILLHWLHQGRTELFEQVDTEEIDSRKRIIL